MQVSSLFYNTFPLQCYLNHLIDWIIFVPEYPQFRLNSTSHLEPTLWRHKCLHPIFDTTGAVVTLNSVGQPVTHIGNVLTIKTADGLKNDGSSPQKSIPQQSIPVQVGALIYFVTSQVMRYPQVPTMTPKFALTPGCVNRKIANYRTKTSDELYKRATISLYSDSEGNFSFISE